MGLLCCALTSCEKENHLFNEDQDGLISSQQRYITLTIILYVYGNYRSRHTI